MSKIYMNDKDANQLARDARIVRTIILFLIIIGLIWWFKPYNYFYSDNTNEAKTDSTSVDSTKITTGVKNTTTPIKVDTVKPKNYQVKPAIKKIEHKSNDKPNNIIPNF